MCCFLVSALCSQCVLGLFLVRLPIHQDNIAPLAWLSNPHCAPRVFSCLLSSKFLFSTRAQSRTLNRGVGTRHHRLVYRRRRHDVGQCRSYQNTGQQQHRRAGSIHTEGGRCRGPRDSEFPRFEVPMSVSGWCSFHQDDTVSMNDLQEWDACTGAQTSASAAHKFAEVLKIRHLANPDSMSYSPVSFLELTAAPRIMLASQFAASSSMMEWRRQLQRW